MTLVHCVDIGTFGALAHCAGGDIPGVILPILAGQPHSWTQGHSFSLSEHCEPGGGRGGKSVQPGGYPGVKSVDLGGYELPIHLISRAFSAVFGFELLIDK